MQNHVLKGNFVRVLHAQRDHGQAVADEDHVDAGVVGDVGRGKVVGRDHGDGLLAAIERLQGVHRHLLARIGGRCAEGRMRAVSSLDDGGSGSGGDRLRRAQRGAQSAAAPREAQHGVDGESTRHGRWV